MHTGHSLGRSKRKRLLASGVKGDQIEMRYNMSRRINAEENTLGVAEIVITSTNQEIEEQYGLYDYYQPQQMRVVPPGTDVKKFHPPKGSEFNSNIMLEINRFLTDPDKPMVLAISRPDHRKNIATLIEAFGESPALQQATNFNNRELLSVENPHLFVFSRFDLSRSTGGVLVVANFDAHPQYLDLNQANVKSILSYGRIKDLVSGDTPAMVKDQLVIPPYHFYWLSDQL